MLLGVILFTSCSSASRARNFIRYLGGGKGSWASGIWGLGAPRAAPKTQDFSSLSVQRVAKTPQRTFNKILLVTSADLLSTVSLSGTKLGTSPPACPAGTVMLHTVHKRARRHGDVKLLGQDHRGAEVGFQARWHGFKVQSMYSIQCLVLKSTTGVPIVAQRSQTRLVSMMQV